MLKKDKKPIKEISVIKELSSNINIEEKKELLLSARTALSLYDTSLEEFGEEILKLVVKCDGRLESILISLKERNRLKQFQKQLIKDRYLAPKNEKDKKINPKDIDSNVIYNLIEDENNEKNN